MHGNGCAPNKFQCAMEKGSAKPGPPRGGGRLVQARCSPQTLREIAALRAHCLAAAAGAGRGLGA